MSTRPELHPFVVVCPRCATFMSEAEGAVIMFRNCPVCGRDIRPVPYMHTGEQRFLCEMIYRSGDYDGEVHFGSPDDECESFWIEVREPD